MQGAEFSAYIDYSPCTSPPVAPCRYNELGAASSTQPGIPPQLAASVVSSRLKLQGFIVMDYAKEWPQALAQLAAA